MKKKLMALLLAFMMILSNFVPVITRAQENEGKEDFNYIGYTAGPAGVGQKLYVEKKMMLVIKELSIVLTRLFTGQIQRPVILI